MDGVCDVMVIVPLTRRAQAIVRAAGASADKTFFAVATVDEVAINEADKAGYLVPMRGYRDLWRITARGEAYLAQLRGAH